MLVRYEYTKVLTFWALSLGKFEALCFAHKCFQFFLDVIWQCVKGPNVSELARIVAAATIDVL